MGIIRNIALKTAIKKALLDVDKEIQAMRLKLPGVGSFGEAVMIYAKPFIDKGLIAETWEGHFFGIVAQRAQMEMPSNYLIQSQPELTKLVSLISEWVASRGGNTINIYSEFGGNPDKPQLSPPEARKTDSEEAFYAQAWNEMNDSNRTPNKAAWAKAFSLSQGDEKKTQARYIELRVAQFQEEQAVRLLQLKTEQEQARRNIAMTEAEEKTKAKVEAEKRNAEKITSDERQALARKIGKIGGLDDAVNLIEKLGGTWQKDMGWFSIIIRVKLWGKNHEFTDIPNFISWVKRDIIPGVLDECQRTEKNGT